MKTPEVAMQLKSFVAEKEAQANMATNEDVSEYAAYFAAAKRGDWLTVSNTFQEFAKHAGQYEHSGKTDERLRGTKWQAVMEIWGALDDVTEGDEKYSIVYANDIISSIPPGSIYFGGTDPGRFLVTAMQKNQVAGDPFFTLTQNALADSTYLDYLREMYGRKIYTPTTNDLEKAFKDYTEDVTRRHKMNQLKPGENVNVDPHNGQVHISGQVAVMEINGLLVKVIFDKDPDREFYIEESFPLDWMYPYLEPHGLIMKINRQPLAKMPGEIVQRDQDYWTKTISPMIGGWLNRDTSVGEVAAFAAKVFARHDFTGFTGDPRFVQNAYSYKMFSKERSSIAGLYAWRAQHTTDALEKRQMNEAADFAFRQSLALCPYSPEAVFRYVNFLESEKRGADALLIAETAANMPEMQGDNGQQLRDLVSQLERTGGGN